MLKTILAVFGFMIICTQPILSIIFITAAATIALSNFPSPRPQKTKKEPAPTTKPIETKGFKLMKEIQEENCKRFLKPGFQDDPEWQRKTAEIHKIMDENRRIQEEKRANGDWS